MGRRGRTCNVPSGAFVQARRAGSNRPDMRFAMKMSRSQEQSPPPTSARRRYAIAGTLLLASGMLPALAAPADRSDFNGLDVSNASIPASAILRGGPPRDGIPAIDHPKFVRA